ncbi:hypothetical protein C1T31_08015 [Hanstruepera neustonica]|uniref:DUF3185 domain-containing protein n=1 Tax=Hanstruepera neustonica TaxID=1445657 RepID=A0A2K1DZM2_9FLAO|nr:hypothetical protein [Hanstruepera neustonica]PNQ73444.1 hypothetical protein C1T31_08015 [Hanstruepera neustonica]
MNNTIKKILLIVGIIIVGYGIYTLVAPEASIGIGDLSIEAQDNDNSYVTIALGLASIALSFLGRKK